MPFRAARTAPVPESQPREPYLAFRVGQDEFLTPVRRIRQLIANPQILLLPASHPLLLGLMHVSGRAAPVLDLDARLGAPSTLHGSALVVELESRSGPLLAGLLVDKFYGEISLSPSQIGPGTPPVHGIVRSRGKTRFVLDLSQMFPPDELGRIESLLAPMRVQ